MNYEANLTIVWGEPRGRLIEEKKQSFRLVRPMRLVETVYYQAKAMNLRKREGGAGQGHCKAGGIQGPVGSWKAQREGHRERQDGALGERLSGRRRT